MLKFIRRLVQAHRKTFGPTSETTLYYLLADTRLVEAPESRRVVPDTGLEVVLILSLIV